MSKYDDSDVIDKCGDVFHKYDVPVTSKYTPLTPATNLKLAHALVGSVRESIRTLDKKRVVPDFMLRNRHALTVELLFILHIIMKIGHLFFFMHKEERTSYEEDLSLENSRDLVLMMMIGM